MDARKEVLSLIKKAGTPISAIRQKCRDCCCNQIKDINECPVVECPLWPYRYRKRPNNVVDKLVKDYEQIYGEEK